MYVVGEADSGGSLRPSQGHCRFTVVALKIRHVKFGNVYFLDEYLE